MRSHARRGVADVRRDRVLRRLGYRVLRLDADLVLTRLAEGVEQVRGERLFFMQRLLSRAAGTLRATTGQRGAARWAAEQRWLPPLVHAQTDRELGKRQANIRSWLLTVVARQPGGSTTKQQTQAGRQINLK